jgi:hypothetical protein
MLNAFSEEIHKLDLAIFHMVQNEPSLDKTLLLQDWYSNTSWPCHMTSTIQILDTDKFGI